MTFLNATKTSACLMMYIGTDRAFWIACDLKTGAFYGRFDGGWFA